MNKSIMVQGTMSNVGKSILVAGLCRIFKQDGYSVAPFKSQNMALNSFITADGLEMGRAQVMQAEAAGIEPQAIMNPILLKPTSSVGSQVIVNGEVIGNQKADEYIAYKEQLRGVVKEAYNTLASEYDIVVLEGAGSPAEINLREYDLVNMGMAKMTQSPVLLAGDIDLGGVFAQLYGTVQLFSEDDRSMLKGLLINKFRGDIDILKPGLIDLERLCGVPVVGLAEYMDLDIDDEDSLAPRLDESSASAVLDIAVVRLPHLSNFTDFNQLSRHRDIGVRYVTDAESLGRPDLVIMPGTKNTMADMRWLWESGLARCIKKLSSGNTPIIGICGGYQMLGEAMSDPDGVETGGDIEGLALLPMRTIFTPEKTRTRTSATLHLPSDSFFASLDGMALEGYEIHMGRTEGSCPSSVVLHMQSGDVFDGGAKGTVLGTYLHGFFDADGVVEKLAELLLDIRGLTSKKATLENYTQHKERQYDLLAEGMRKHFDMEAIYKIVEAGI